MRYSKIENVPTIYKSVAERAIKQGIIDVDEKNEFDLSEDLLKMILMLGRLGLI
ncbi:MAG: hypothetical protein KIC94_12770 [Clostridiales bacterium]|nr:hypothetical protein [Clostridiales bacterium]